MSIFDFLWKGRTPQIDTSDDDDARNKAMLLPPPPNPAPDLAAYIDKMAFALAARAKSVYPGELIAPHRSGRPHQVWNELSLKTAVKEGLAANVWLWACARLIVEALKSIPWIAQEAQGQGWRPAALRSPALDLWTRPNAHYSEGLLTELVAYQLLLTGNTGISKIRDSRGVVGELWNIIPDRFAAVPDASKLYVSKYQFYKENGATGPTAAPEDFIHLMFLNPCDPFRGFGPTTPGGRSIDIDRKAQDWNTSALDNRASPSGALIYDHDVSWEQYIEAKKILEDQLIGAQNAGLPVVLGNAAKWVKWGWSAVDLDWLGGRDMSADEVCAVMGVPPVLAGRLKHATYSNFETAERVFWRNTVGPLAIGIAGHLNHKLTPEFHDPKRLRIWPNLEAIPAYRSLTKEQADIAKVFWSMGWTRNQVNRRMDLGFEEDADGDVSYVEGEPAALLLADPLLAGTASTPGKGRPTPLPIPLDPPPSLPPAKADTDLPDAIAALDRLGVAARGLFLVKSDDDADAA